MAEATNELRLVEGVSSHLHATHGLHLLVHGKKRVLGHLHVERGHVAVVGAEGLLMKLDGEGL